MKKLSTHVLGILFFTLMLSLPGCQQAKTAINSVDDAIAAINRGGDSFEDFNRILDDLKTNLDEGRYKDQVDGIVENAGGVVQKTTQGTIDFARARVLEDLHRLKSNLLGTEPPEKKPVLSTVQNAAIRFDTPSNSRSSLNVVGWNLSVAEKDREKYYVTISNPVTGDRRVANEHIAYQGDYEVSINLSNNGTQLKPHDTQLVFNGFDQKVLVNIENSKPLPPQYLYISGSLFALDDESGWPQDDETETRGFEIPAFKLERGKAKAFSRLVTIGVGKEVRADVDYSVSCAKNGTAKVNVDLKLYEGTNETRTNLRKTGSKAFTVAPGESISPKPVEVTWSGGDKMRLKMKIENETAKNRQDYTVKINTARRGDAGSDAKVFVKIVGREGTMRKFSWSGKGRRFEQGSKDKFTINANSVGEIASIVVGHDNSGNKPGWYPDLIEVYDHAAKKNYRFVPGKWFATSHGDKKIERTVKPSK